jgi:hypothetical protein
MWLINWGNTEKVGNIASPKKNYTFLSCAIYVIMNSNNLFIFFKNENRSILEFMVLFAYGIVG